MVLTGILLAPVRKETPRAASMADDIRAPSSPSARFPVCPAQSSQTKGGPLFHRQETTPRGEVQSSAVPWVSPLLPHFRPGWECSARWRAGAHLLENREREGRPLFLSSQTEPAKDRPTPQHPCSAGQSVH